MRPQNPVPCAMPWSAGSSSVMLAALLLARTSASLPDTSSRRGLQQGDIGPGPPQLPLGGPRGDGPWLPPRPRRPYDPDQPNPFQSGPGTPAVPYVNTTLPTPSKLLWADEFDGTGLDETKWNVEEGDGSKYNIPGWGNDELEVYDKRAVSVRNGQLIINAWEAGLRADGNMTYTSGKVSTAYKAAFRPTGETPRGIRVEASVFLPTGGPGIWPSVWMLPLPEAGAKCYGCGRYGPWPTSGEINLMEAINDMGTTFGWAHYGGPAVNIPDVSMLGGASLNASSARVFHSYSLDWSWQNMTFGVDNHSFAKAHCSQNVTDGGWYTTNPAKIDRVSSCAPFDQPFYIVIQLAVGGGWPGYPTKATQFPQYMAVDYVRVYEL